METDPCRCQLCVFEDVDQHEKPLGLKSSINGKNSIANDAEHLYLLRRSRFDGNENLYFYRHTRRDDE